MEFLIWSQRHKAWWRADRAGYTEKRSEAGHYTTETIALCSLDGTRKLWNYDPKTGAKRPKAGAPTCCDILVVVNPDWDER